MLLFGCLYQTAAKAETLTVLSQNLHRLFNSIDDGYDEKIVSPAIYQRRLKLATHKIRYQFKYPQVIALQEVENVDVLFDIAKEIVKNHGPGYQTVLLEGHDRSGIDVGYLIRSSFKIKQVRQLFKHQRTKGYGTVLFSRPPLLVEACHKKRCLTLVNLHLRSMLGLRSKNKGHYVATKRRQQATVLARWVNKFQSRHSLMLLGDFNALTPSDRYTDIVGTIRGNPKKHTLSFPSQDWIKRDLIDLTLTIPASQRFSYIYKKKKQIIDYMLVNQSFKPRLKSIRFEKIDRKFSDHAGLLASFEW